MYQYQTLSYHETYTFQPTNIHVIKTCSNIKLFPFMKRTPFRLQIFTLSKRVPISNSFLSGNIKLQLTNIHVINVYQYQTLSYHETYTFQPTNIHVIKTCTNNKLFPIRKHKTSANKYSCNKRVPILNPFLSWNVHISAFKYSRNQRLPISNSFLSWNLHLQLTNIRVINV